MLKAGYVRKIAMIALAILSFQTTCLARERCSVRVIRNVRAEETSESVLKKGDLDYGPVTQLRINKKTGKMVFCAHGSYCYVASALEIISPCQFSPDTFDDPDDFYFSAR